MSVFPEKLLEKLQKRREDKALRSLPKMVAKTDFSSNDYLGFSRSVELFNAATAILKEKKVMQNGATGSRLLTGNHQLYTEVEELLCAFYTTEAALVFNSGYDANIGFFSSVPQRSDTVLFDEYIHASIRDGLQLSNAKTYKFKHNDLQDLEAKLKKNAKLNEGDSYVVTESVFSMDGDSPDLVKLVELVKKHNAYLVVDEAHAVGVFGKKGEGLIQQLNLQEYVFARIITFGKALGCHGAAVLGSAQLKEYLVNYARSLIYTTGLSPHTLAAIHVAYNELQSIDEHSFFKKNRKALKENIKYFKENIHNLKFSLNDRYFQSLKKQHSSGNDWKFNTQNPASGFRHISSDSAIQSCIIPGNENVKKIAMKFQKKGYDIKPILSPTVPKGEERLRFCVHSFNNFEEISDILYILSTHNWC